MKFDADFLAAIDLGQLAEDDQQSLLDAIVHEFNLRLGALLAPMMSADDLDEFERALDAADRASAEAVIDRVCPDRRKIIDEVASQVVAEVADAAERILTALARTNADPYLLNSADGWSVVVASDLSMTVSVSEDGLRCYAQRSRGLPVILIVPPDVVLNPEDMWCDSDQVTAGESDVDLVWAIPADTTDVIAIEPVRIASPVRPYLPTPQRYARLSQDRRVGELVLSDGPGPTLWVQRPAGPSFGLRSDDERDRKGVVVSPDESQLIAFYEAPARMKVASYDYMVDIPLDDEAAEWEDTVDVDDWLGKPYRVWSIAFNATNTQALVDLGNNAQRFDVRSAWAFRGALRHSHARARVVDTDHELSAPATLVWAGQTLVIADGGRLRALLHGDPREKLVNLDYEIGPAPIACFQPVGDDAVAVLADRTVLTIDRDGSITSRTIAGDEPVRAAAVTRSGAVLVATDVALELHRHHSGHQVAVQTGSSPVAGIAPCRGTSSWALVWFEDGSFATVEVHPQRLSLHRDRIPNRPTDLGQVRVAGAVWPEFNDWALLVEPSNGGDRYIATPARQRLPGSNALWYMESAALYVAGASPGKIRFSPHIGSGWTSPWPVDLGERPIWALAPSPDPRVIAVVAAGRLSLIRLLT